MVEIETVEGKKLDKIYSKHLILCFSTFFFKSSKIIFLLSSTTITLGQGEQTFLNRHYTFVFNPKKHTGNILM